MKSSGIAMLIATYTPIDLLYSTVHIKIGPLKASFSYIFVFKSNFNLPKLLCHFCCFRISSLASTLTTTTTKTHF